jgi:hypothetical protein
VRKDQFDLLRSQIYDDGRGVMYDILLLVEWAQEHCDVVELHVDDLRESYDDSYSEEDYDSPEFIERALRAEDYPLLVFDRGGSGYELVDGRHRLWKATFLGKTHVRCYLMDESKLPESVIYFSEDEIEVA